MTVMSAIWETFSEFLIFCNLFHEPLEEWIKANYHKRGKCKPIFHEATCDNYL